MPFFRFLNDPAPQHTWEFDLAISIQEKAKEPRQEKEKMGRMKYRLHGEEGDADNHEKLVKCLQ